MTFRLYPEEQAWWSYADYGAVLAVMQRLKPKRVLEFGPGSSTLALIEGGAEHIDSCEDDPHWFGIYVDRIESNYRGILKLRPYIWSDPVAVPGLFGERFDLALIDGPRDTDRRTAVVDYCLAHSTHVLVPVEETPDGFPSLLREYCLFAAKATGRQVEFTETGPLAGAFALIGPPC